MLRMNKIGGFGLLLVLLAGFSMASVAERMALVIGNSGYSERPLRNPPNDARAMTGLLRTLGFRVIEKTDLNLSGFRQQVNAFLDQSQGAKVRLFYYSGHGASYDGDNYLLPIGHGVTRKHELPDQAYSLKTLLRGFKEHSGVNLVLLDSCRDAPFGDAKSNWDDSKGMKPIQPKQTGVFISYAADQGQTASDNWGGRNSLYTTHLLQHLGQSLELREALMRVQQEVYAESHNQQLPMMEDRVLGKVYLAGGSSESPPPTVDHDLIAWQSAEKCGTAACFRAYLKKHPQGQYAEMAQARLKPEPAPPPRPVVETLIGDRYRDHADGTVTDVKTGLQWMRCSLGQTWRNGTCVGKAESYAWQGALDAAAKVSNRQGGYADYSDWRVPTKEELQTLIYCSSGWPKTWNDTGNSCGGDYERPTLYRSVFLNARSWYWSSSTYASSPGSAWSVDFSVGYVNAYGKWDDNCVRLVRGGQ